MTSPLLRSPHPRRRPLPHRGGFSLIELVMSMAAMAIILGGLTSAITLAGYAASDGKSVPERTTAAARAANEVLADLNVASEFTERTDRAVTFYVPDRDGDGDAELIRYAWSGTPGTPLTRAYNGGTAVNVTKDVQNLSFSYLLRTMPRAKPKEVESEEKLLISHDDIPLVGSFVVSELVVNKNGYGTQFKPDLPANTIRWKINRIRLVVEKIDDSGALKIQIREAATANNLPVGAVLREITLPMAGRSTNPAWVDIPLEPVEGLDPAKGYCILVTHGASTNRTGTAGRIQFEDGGVSPLMPTNATMLSTGDGGVSWKIANGTKWDLRFFVYGTVTTPAN